MPIERPMAPVKPLSPERPKIPQKETLTTGKEIISRIVSMIGQAKYSVDLQFYTFEADATGKKVLDAIRAAKERNPNLQVRLLADNSIDYFHGGSLVHKNGNGRQKRDETYELLNSMKAEGILDVKITNWFSRNPISLISNIIHRDHKKLVLVDSRDLALHPDAHPMAMVTSANIAEQHEYRRKEVGRVYHGTDGPIPLLQYDFNNSEKEAQEWERVYSVRSIGEYIKRYGFINRHMLNDALGSIVRNPQKSGEKLIYKEGTSEHPDRYNAVLTDSFWSEKFSRPFEQLFGKKIGSREATNEGFVMLDRAKPGEEVIVFTPYPGIFSLTKHLVNASQRGVKVHLIIAQNYEHELINPKNLATWQKPLGRWYSNWPKRIVQSGVVLHEYTGKKEGLSGELHAKGVVWMRSDGSVRTLIGSTNFSKGPVSGMNREIAVVEESDMSDPLVQYAYNLIDDSELYALPATRRGTKAA